MSKVKRIFIVEDAKPYTDKFLSSGIRKQVKGFIRLGHDVHRFDYGGAFWNVAPVKSKLLSRKWVKGQVDELLVKQLKYYMPDIVYISFANFLDVDTIAQIRLAVPDAFLYGFDGDPWPQYQTNRVEIGSKLDLVLATNDGEWLDVYREAGVNSVFMPNPCDPDYQYRYDVADKWKSDLLFVGKSKASRKYPTDPMRSQLIEKLVEMPNCTSYGCLGRPRIGGLDFQYAISGARVALSINAINNVRLCHSDRLTHFLASGTFVLAKRVPDSDLLFKDGEHLRYFDTEEEFFELADWYLKYEDERLKIANAGMARIHAEFSGKKIAEYTLDVIANGDYSAPWR